MKQSILVLVVVFGLIGLMSNSGGRGLVGGPATTAPGESGQFCGSTGCHSSGSFSPKLDIVINNSDGEIVNEYIPGEEYTVSVEINAVGNPSRYGFQ
ncbi:MAG: hypothetical protein HKN67_01220, partial [Saprospiraceae bacterium]|nr:hypothetical protein [Saprospiraceae bacterium]